MTHLITRITFLSKLMGTSLTTSSALYQGNPKDITMGKSKKSQKQINSDSRYDEPPAYCIFAHVDRALSRPAEVPCKMTFFIDWELNEFVCSHLDGSWNSLSELTTGNGPSGQAEIICEQYLICHWGYDSIGILTRVAECYEYDKSSSYKSHLGVRYNISHVNKYDDAASDLIVDVEGKPNDLINMIKMFSWLTGTFRMPGVGESTYSYCEPWINFHDNCKPYCGIHPKWKYNWEYRLGT
ncbi:hypothetical protein BDW59DRAFT_142251 [Aspergillus cavernicola]|uniref:Uncharacterized protein n=1 Tax=Aspergillus cavernicola TaxID=176166 RepID=A0ABR4INB6_9EURO